MISFAEKEMDLIDQLLIDRVGVKLLVYKNIFGS